MAEDFAQWAVQSALEKINRGVSKYPHLQNSGWLFKAYIETHYGAYTKKGKRWLEATKTAYLDNLVYALDREKCRFVDLVPSSEATPEEWLLAKEKVESHPEYNLIDLVPSNDANPEERLLVKEQAEGHPDFIGSLKRKKTKKERDEMVLDYLRKACDDGGEIYLLYSKMARGLGLEPMEFRNAVLRLHRKGVIFLKGRLVRVPAQGIQDAG